MALILRGLSKALSELKLGVFLCDTQNDELFLLRLFVHMGGESEPNCVSHKYTLFFSSDIAFDNPLNINATKDFFYRNEG